MKQSFDELIAQVAKMEGELKSKVGELAAQAQQTELFKKKSELLEGQAGILHVLSANLTGLADPAQVYGLVCQSIVHQLNWQSSFVVSVSDGFVKIEASFGATETQLGSVSGSLASVVGFIDAYSKGAVVSTFEGADEKLALQLRSVFSTDEVVAVPLDVAKHVYGYVVACRQGEAAHSQAPETQFLSEVAFRIAQSIQNSTVLSDLEAQNAQLRQLDQLKTNFIAITSHQLRTPLSVVKWILSLLQSDPQVRALNSQIQMVNQAYEGNERLIHVVNDMLNVSRIQNGRLPHNPQLLDIKPVLNELVGEAEKLVATKTVQIKAELSDKLPPVQVDPLLYKEALQNIIINAIDYSADNGTIVIKSEFKDDAIRVSVTNPGVGISAEEGPKVFDQFYRGTEATRLHPDGSGLGLYLSKAIIGEHGGSITFESDPGKQTVFTVSIPVGAAQ